MPLPPLPLTPGSWDALSNYLVADQYTRVPIGIAPRTVMASPPTLSAPTLVDGIASSVLWPSCAQTGGTSSIQLGGYFTYSGAAGLAPAGVTFPDDQFVKLTSLTSTNFSTAPYNVSFMFEGTTLEVVVKGNTAGLLLFKVDDQYITLTPTQPGNAGSTVYIPITFATRAMRRIDVLTAGMFFGGVVTGPNDTIMPAELRGPRCIVIGDSFTDGTGATAGAASDWARVFGDHMGWDDVWCSADGATGWLATASGARPNFRQRIQHDCILWNPRVVIVQGGINDWGTFTAAQISAEATTLIQQIRTALPGALLVVLSPFWRNGPATFGVTGAGLINTRDALKNAALLNGATFLDVLEIPLTNEVNAISTTASSSITQFGITCSLPVLIPPRSVFKVDSGLPTEERVEVKTVAGGGPYTHTIDGQFQFGHASGARVVQVGRSLWSGTGHVGATSGYGNADLIVSSDGTHPSQEGHDVLGRTIAALFQQAVHN